MIMIILQNRVVITNTYIACVLNNPFHPSPNMTLLDFFCQM